MTTRDYGPGDAGTAKSGQSYASRAPESKREFGPGDEQYRWACPLCRARGINYSMARLTEDYLYLAIGLHMAIRHTDVAPIEKFTPRADGRILLSVEDAKFMLACGIAPE